MWLSYRVQKYKEISTRLNNIFSSYNLQDVWRIKNPTKPAFTWRRQTPRIQTDRQIFIDDGKPMQTYASLKMNICTRLYTTGLVC